MPETWYVDENGEPADPAGCSFEKGKLVSADGTPIALRRPDAYSSRSVNPDDYRKKPKRTYRNRQMKSED